MLFVLLDKAVVENDRKIADHVVRMHRYEYIHPEIPYRYFLVMVLEK